LGLTAIGNATDGAVGTVPTQFDYANANVTGIDSSVKLQLINDVVKSLVLANVDTVGEVQSLSDAVTAVINSPAGGTPPTWVQLNALGILGITSGNLSAVLAAIANTSPDGSAVDTQSNVTLTPTYSNQTLTAGNLVTASGSTGVVTIVLNGVTYFRLGDLNATESLNLSFSSPVNTVVITWYLQTGNSDTNRFEDVSMSANGSPITFLAANLVAQTGMSISSTDPTKIVCVGQGGDTVTPAVYTYTGTGITSFSVTDNFRSGTPNGIDVQVAASTPGFGTAVSNLAPAITADPGGTSIRGYAITAAAASGNDKWQYSTNGGTVWNDLTAVRHHRGLHGHQWQRHAKRHCKQRNHSGWRRQRHHDRQWRCGCDVRRCGRRHLGAQRQQYCQARQRL
jgi:hypothetical protein